MIWSLQKTMSILLLLLSVSCPYCLGIEFDTGASKSVNAFVALLNLTDQTCDTIEWCTIQSFGPLDHQGSVLRGACCPTCSCKKQCFQDRNCCPDIKLRQYLNETMFSNTSQLVTKIKEIDNLNRLDISYRNDARARTSVGKKCIRSAVLEHFLYSTKAPRYLMVANCQSSSVSADVKNKCEEKRDLTDELQLEDIWPVQSRRSGIVYRNIHCFKCSKESGHIVEMWDVYLVDRVEVVPRIMSVVINYLYPDIVAYVLQQRDGTNLVFEPSRELLHSRPPSECVNVDVVDTCGNDVTDIHEHIREACQSFSLPMYLEYKNNNTAFQNLACIYCNGIETKSRKEGVCSNYAYWSIKPFLWKLRKELLQNVKSNDEQSPGQADTTINVFQSSRCNSGFVFDSFQKLCRRMYCPCGMMVHNATCIPVFSTVPGKIYEVFFSVIATRRIEAEPSDAAIITHFQHYFDTKEDLEVVDIALWKTDNSGSYKDTIVNLFLAAKPRSINYNYLLKTVYNMSKGTQIITFNKTIFVDISLVDVIRVIKDIVVPKMQRKYILVNATTWAHFDMSTHDTILVRSCQFCYLVELIQDDIEIKNGWSYYLPRTKTYGSLETIAAIEGTQRRFICAKEVIEQVEESKVEDPLDSGCCSSLQEGTGNDKPRSPQTTSVIIEIFIGVSTVAILLAILLVFANGTRRKVRLAEISADNTNTADALEMSNVN